jgi:hypothetical protein
VQELNAELVKLNEGFGVAYGDDLLWLAASEYVITPVDHVTYPNRVLRDAGLLRVRETADGEYLDVLGSDAWALVDHQFSHVFVREQSAASARRVADLFRGQPGFAEVLVGDERYKYALAHARAGEVILISSPTSWQAYYYWPVGDADAPRFARTVDIHSKPGYDPVELHFDPVNKCIPLDATLIRGSHGAPAEAAEQQGIVVSSRPGVLGDQPLRDVHMAARVLGQFVSA